ncbi:hypothetical protein GCM10027040_23800 [Halomonas shantousis]
MIAAVSRCMHTLAALAVLGSALGAAQAAPTPSKAEQGSTSSVAGSTGNGHEGGSCPLNDMERELLERVNEARGQARQCGDEKFEAVRPLDWNCRLEAAAEVHSKDMAANEYFDHASPEGVQIGERVKNQGYDWMAVGENIAVGQDSVAAVVDGWLASPGHCANIMNDTFTEMGVAKAENVGKMYSPYWTQVFARPR